MTSESLAECGVVNVGLPGVVAVLPVGSGKGHDTLEHLSKYPHVH